MRIRPALRIALLFIAATASAARAQPESKGPDVIVGEIAGDNDISRFASSGGISAYAFRTESCNIGDQELVWYSNTNQHPIISQNMFRLMNGRFEQIGQAWVKHGFATENNQLCGACQPTDGETLGVGCSDAYSSGLNGLQSQLGPKSQVNASKGYFLYPFSAPSPSPGLGRRLQVRDSDLEASLNPGALYFIEAQYVAPDDAYWGNGWNNSSWRQITFTPTFPFTATPVGPTFQREPAILAWVANDPTVRYTQLFVENDGDVGYYGVFWVAGKATFLGGCSWRYEYAVHNVDSFQSAAKFTVDLPAGVVLSNIGFHDVAYHSGEPYSGTDWTSSVSAGSITWSTQNLAQNPNANALRWATLYNFRFDADAPPTCSGTVSIGLFRSPDISISETMLTPRAGSGCYKVGDMDNDCDLDGADFYWFQVSYGHCEGSGQFNAEADMDDDGCVDLVDYQFWLIRYREYVNNPLAPPPLALAPMPADLNDDGIVNHADLGILVDVLLGIGSNPKADLDGDGVADARDIQPFINAMMFGN